MANVINKLRRPLPRDYPVLRDRVKAELDRIRPAVQANGKDIELCRIEGNDIEVALRGNFESEPGSMIALKLGIERSLRQSIRGIDKFIACIPETCQHPCTD